MTRAITMPKWGLTMTEGKVVRWSVPPGGSFSAGDELLEIETSKITNVVEAEGDGTLLRVVAPEGATLPIGALLAVTGPAGTSDAEVDAYVAGFEVVAPVEGAEDAADEAVAPRLVYGESVRQVQSYVEQDEVYAGIVYSTDALLAGDKVKVVATTDDGTHDVIEYPAAVVAGSAHAPAAKKFLDYVSTDQAKSILILRGFTIPSPSTRPSP